MTSLNYIMAVPRRLVARRLGHLHDETMMKVNKVIEKAAFRSRSSTDMLLF